MAEQFLNYEGRNTFNSANGYEKTKVVNGGAPQNIDLNEQSAIDEFMRRRIIVDGFTQGKKYSTDFILSYSGGSLSLSSGTLWQDGYRLNIASNQTIDTTKDYKSVAPSPAVNRNGRVYLVHAKQDYLDPARKLTVLDKTGQAIQVDTAVVERRLWDIYIDWDSDESGTNVDRIDSNEAQILDDSTGHAFDGKESFADSAINGYTGYIYYLGDINLQSPNPPTFDQASSQEFNGAPDTELYTGGDLAHRRDTERAGLIYSSAIGSYDGLQASLGAVPGSPYSYPAHASGITTWYIKKINIKQTATGEQLHFPDLNAYTDLASDQAFNIVNIVSDVFLKSILDEFGASPSEDDVTDGVYVLKANALDLTKATSYSITKLGNNSVSDFVKDRWDVDSDEANFVIATFRFVLYDIVGGTDGYVGFETDAGDISYLWDRRTYQINALDKIKSSFQENVANLHSRYIFRVDAVGTFGVENVYVGDRLSGRVIKVVAPNLLYVTMSQGTPLVGNVITDTGASPSKTATIQEIVASPLDTPVIVKGDTDYKEGSTLLPYDHDADNDESDLQTVPSSLDTALAKIRGAFAALLPTTLRDTVVEVTNYWNQLHKKGIELPKIILCEDELGLTGGQFICKAPTRERLVGGTHIQMPYGNTSFDKGELTTQLINVTRALSDDQGVSTSHGDPIIEMSGQIDSAVGTWGTFLKLRTYYGSGTGLHATSGGMIVLEGRNGIVAVPFGTDFPGSVLNVNPSNGNVAVIIDGESGKISAYEGYIRNLSFQSVSINTVNSVFQILGQGSTFDFSPASSGSFTIGSTLTSPVVFTLKGTVTTITGAQLNTLSDGSDADSLHTHESLSNIYGGISDTNIDSPGTRTLAVDGTYYQYNGFTTNDDYEGATPDYTNYHITADSAGKYFVSISATFSGTNAADLIRFKVFKNNGATAFENLQNEATVYAVDERICVSISGVIELSDGDTLELWVANIGATNSIKIYSANMFMQRVGT